MRIRAALTLLIALAAAAPAAAQPVVTSPAPNKIEVTVYRDPDRGERATQVFRKIGKLVRAACHVGDRDGAGAADAREHAVLERHGSGLALEQQRRDLFAFPDDLLRRAVDHDARKPQAASRVRAAAELHELGVSREDAHVLAGDVVAG